MDGMQCVIEGCPAPAKSRGWCQMHYARWKRHGDPLAVGVSKAPIPPGTVFGRLRVVEISDRREQDKRLYRCLCECGNDAVVLGTRLKNGRTRSCGCLRRETTRALGMNSASSNTTHGLHDHPLYAIWRSMRARCDQPTHPSYKWYGARGIRVTVDWEGDVSAFAEWAFTNGWQRGYHIHRVDNDGPYSPENCCWLSAQEHGQVHGRARSR